MTDANITKLPPLDGQNGSLSGLVYSTIKAAILSLEFQPGESIRKTDLCDHLGVSRSPVSDALAKLSNEGLVDIVPQSGTRVSKISMTAIREQAFLREAVEVAATRHATLNSTPEIIARLKRNLEMLTLIAKDADKDDFIETDDQFHEILLSTTGVTRLSETINTASSSIYRARLLMIPAPGRLNDTIDEHAAIIDAIAQRDVPRAEDAMRHHVNQILKRLETLAKDRSELVTS